MVLDMDDAFGKMKHEKLVFGWLPKLKRQPETILTQVASY
jgi:hypothetical protein